MDRISFLENLPGTMTQIPAVPKRRGVGSMHEEEQRDYDRRVASWLENLRAAEEKTQRRALQVQARAAVNATRASIDGLLGFRSYSDRYLDSGEATDYAHLMGRLLSPPGADRAENKEEIEPRRVLGAVLRNTHGVSGLTRPAALDGLLGFARAVATNPSMLESTVVSVGFDSPDADGLSIRLPLYLLPALELMSDLAALGLPTPRLRLFIAVNAGCAVNGFREEAAQRNAAITRQILGGFVERFYPALRHRMTFDEDAQEYGEELGGLEAGLAQLLREEEMLAPDMRSDLVPVMRLLQEQALSKGRGSPMQRALRYGALHPFFFRDMAADPELAQQYTISIGGPPERYFNYLRAVLTEWARVSGCPTHFPRSSLMLLTDVGRNPVYFPMKGESTLQSPGDLEWDELVANPAVRRDWQELERSIPPSDYLAWVREIAGSLKS